MRSLVERYEGTVEKFAGDAVVAVFGVPRAHEDDPERAVRCALEIRDALASLNDMVRPRFGVELDVRIGVETGEAVAGGRDALASGDVMNTAARLEQAAAPGEVLVGRDAMRLTRELFEYAEAGAVEARGMAEPVPAWRAVAVRDGVPRPRAALVGRGVELERLVTSLEEAIAGNVRVAVVLGEPGIGKSRLADEFAVRVSGRATILRGGCLPYGEGTLWRPFAQIVRGETRITGEAGAEALARLRNALAGRHAEDEVRLLEAQLAPLVGASGGSVASGAELLWALRRYFEGLAATGTLVLVLDDLHWAGETLVETLQELVQTIAAVPLLFVCQGRPELRERLAETIADERALVLTLAALPPTEADALVRLLGPDWDDETRRAIVARGGGSPLFLEELAAMAAEEGVEGRVPASLRVLIAARLDSLPDGAKQAAQAAAVVGDVFWDGALAALDGAELSSAVRDLRRRGFVDEEPVSAFLGQRQFRFHHALIREVTYDSVPKRERAERHRRTAAWLRGYAGERPALLGPIAHHLERALSLLGEVAPLEPPPNELLEEAVRALREAAVWAAANASVPEAVELLRRAAAATEGHALQSVTQAHLASVLATAGSPAEAVELADGVLAGPADAEATGLASLALALLRGPAVTFRACASTGSGRSKSPGRRASARSRCAPSRCSRTRTSGAGATRRRRIEARVRPRRHSRSVTSPRRHRTPPSRASSSSGQATSPPPNDAPTRRCGSQPSPGAFGRCSRRTRFSGTFAAHRDRLGEALDHGRERLRLAEQLGERLWLVGSYVLSVAVPLAHLGRRDEAWEALEQALALSTGMGGSHFDGNVLALRAELLLADGKVDEAERELRGVAELPEDRQPDAAGARAELAAARGRDEEADRLWNEVLWEFGEDRLHRAEAMARYARFLVSRGRTNDAREVLRQARALVDGTGAALYERLVREAEALLP
jgi:tetratricopeptide (TPR) repeat protein